MSLTRLARWRSVLVLLALALVAWLLFSPSSVPLVLSSPPPAPLSPWNRDVVRPVELSRRALEPHELEHAPFFPFNVTRGEAVTVARFPFPQPYAAAALLDVPFPHTYRTFVCEGAIFDNRMWHEGYAPKMSCGNPRPPPNSGLRAVDRDLVVGYDAAHISFQHDMITGISHASLEAEWVKQRPRERGIMCHRVVCMVLRACLDRESVFERSHDLPKAFWARSVRWNRAPFDGEMSGCEPFPLGSFWPVEVFLASLRASKQLQLPSPSRPKLLYLSRGHGKNSIRWLDNEADLLAALRQLAKRRGWEVEVLGHENVAVSSSTTGLKSINQFHSAAAVVGLHGGAFSNIVFCNREAVILEINNNVNGRECFSGISVSRGLNYLRFQPHREFWYQSWDHFALHAREIRQIVALLDHHVQPEKRVVKTG